MEKTFFVYILTDKPYGTLYVGITNDLARRMWEHKEGIFEGFTERYQLHRLVYYEVYATAAEAIHREKCIKKWKREWKINRIHEQNRRWHDLSENLNN